MLMKSRTNNLFIVIFIFNLPLFEQASYQHRRFVHVTSPMTWSLAQNYCREHHTDLATFRNSDEFDALQHPCQFDALCWIGLQRDKDDLNTWNWSDGEKSNFTNWHKTQPSDPLKEENCVGLGRRYWHDIPCDRQNAFLCYDNPILVKENKTWEEALEHCRTLEPDPNSSTTSLNHRFDLPHMDFGGKNSEARKAILDAQTPEVWIGLRFLAGEWLWVNGTPLSEQLTACPAHGMYCGTMSKTGKLFSMRDCSDRMNFFCSIND